MRVLAQISDGMSRNGGGETTIEAVDLASAKELAIGWAQDGSYASPDGADVSVEVVLDDAATGANLDRFTIACPAAVAAV